MVMSTEPQDVEEVVEEQEVDAPEVETQETTEDEGVEQAEEVASGDTAVVTDSGPSEPQAVKQPKQQPPVDMRAIQELNQRRAYDQQREWQLQVGRRAKAYEQQLQESGYMPEQARDQARRYVQQEQKFRQAEQQTADMLGYTEGRQMAAIYYMKKHGLGSPQMLNDLIALQSALSPADMEKEAQRMKRERSLVAENARLKQGRVPSQTFDNSQGSAEVTTNQGRLLEAYINGDRSDAAVKAARRLATGS